MRSPCDFACIRQRKAAYQQVLIVQGAKARLRKAEQALERVLDAQLGFRQRNNMAGTEDDCSSSDSFPVNFTDDYIDSDAEASSSDDDKPARKLAAVNGEPHAKRPKLDKHNSSGHNTGQ